jgi:O-antigen ligase/polysaccharide polymerase Wzy-like membrane protein
MYHPRSRSIGRVPARAASLAKPWQHPYATSTVERLLLAATILIIPLEPSLPTLGGFTTPYLMFGLLAGYVLAKRPRALARTWSHPVFLAAFSLPLVGAFIESIHPYPSYSDISRIVQMLIAGIFVAVLCRDRRALRTTLYALLIGGIMVSIILFWIFYGDLKYAAAATFTEASKIRKHILTDANVEETLKRLTVYPAMGAAIALSLGLHVRSAIRRYSYFGIALFCVVGTFLPMSRGGIVMVVASCTTILVAYGVRHLRVVLIATALAIGVLIWVPGVVYSRLTVTPETREGGRLDSRRQIYKAAIEHLPEYFFTGVGAGNFWTGPWGKSSEFFRATGVDGAHNAFIQVTLNWGVPALLVLLTVVYLGFRCLPRGGSKDVLVQCLYSICIVIVLQMMVSHVLTCKEFSLTLGLLVGSQRWIWPKGIYLPMRRRQVRPVSAPQYAS